ncbi:hypothetical protein BDN70DRAFT_844679 [Pholiota conissans]|uniref:Uncharacterized protein n=1 Tax=Pholiota conissans TaxID=109636 RepID=A0A9P5YPB1_9AGAR|nr:hypothetical protein BDN70DRAFT_844679 [Pholiota conissans]
MFPAFRRLSLRTELPSNGLSIRCYIHNPQSFFGPSTRGQVISVSETSTKVSTEAAGSSTNPKIYPKKREESENDVPFDDTTLNSSSRTKKSARKIIEPPTKKIEAFLRRAKSENHTLTLADVERCNPSTIPDTRSPRYEAEYNEVMNNLTRSFSMVNMQKIFDLYKMPQLPLSRQNKVRYAQAILEHWGWTPIAVVRDSVLDETKASELHFPLRSEEAFLLMGKDGAELLGLAKRYSVNLSFYDHPMTLKANGLQGSLKLLEGYLKGFKKDIQSEVTSLPLGQSLSFGTLKSISRLSGAYLVPEKDKLRIFFHRNQPWTSKIAQYLSVQAASGETAHTIQAVFSPNVATSGGVDHPSSTYSLYPFSPHQYLSWKIPSSSTFRLRRVGQWLDVIKATNRSIPTDEDFDNSVLFNESASDLKTQLLGQIPIPRISCSSFVVSASTGHCLFLSSISQGQTLTPPLTGRLDRMRIFSWAQEFPGRVAFQPSMPVSLLASSADKEQHVRKLVYVERATTTDHASSNRTLNFEYPQRVKDPKEKEELKPLCFIGQEIRINVLFPDRFTDIQFSAIAVNEVLPARIPTDFLPYIPILEPRSPVTHELAPFELTFEGSTYTLNSDTYIHREFKKISTGGMQSRALVETHVDAGIGKRSTVCKILCDDYSTEVGWKNFLGQCNSLSTSSSFL